MTIPWHNPTPSTVAHLCKRSPSGAPHGAVEKPASLRCGSHVSRLPCLPSMTLPRTREHRSTPQTKTPPTLLRIELP